MTGTDDGALVTLPEDECWELLGLRPVGRIAFIDADGRQQLLPVNYALHGRCVYVRTATGTVLGALADGHDDVALQADHVEDLYQQAWSVTATGTVHEVTDQDMIEQVARSGRPRPWVPGERDLLLEMTPQRIDGRRVRQH
ncbi:pyridoxamine 5'-phosphate oxidase family protein [Aeromicrobium sp. CTD01-1L150]|uniref:pyridoxamine 5'-phosphate oxidase family protein n=1 Tax=Aeromicrobium sp. CTD01-1L150 TaxID=3341830 RepID=UPI0035C025CE